MDTLSSTPCDIILPVYNSLYYVRDCIESVVEHTPDNLYNLYIIDDYSDLATRQFLTSCTAKYSNIKLISNKKNIGFLKSYNKGIKLCNAEYVLLLNSDVVVVKDWLERLLECANSDATIASINPLTNHASQVGIPIAKGANFISMDKFIRKFSKKHYPNVVTTVEFCTLLRKSALENVGLFDEVYGRGYYAESDLCMRFTTNGYRTVVADNVYVFHKGSANLEGKNERYLKNRKIFNKRWLKVYKKKIKAFQKTAPLAYLHIHFKAPQGWRPLTSMRETYRVIRNSYQKGSYFAATKAAIKGGLNLPFYTEDIISNSYLKKISQPKQLQVTYVLHNLTIAGGVLSVVQLVNELILLGVDARIVALYQYPEVKQWKFYFTPILFKNEKKLINNFPDSDIVVATHWTTASWVSKILSKNKATKGVYFLQDYESWFFPESDTKSRSLVKDTYSMINHKIVKSSWLQNLVQKDGHQSKKIWLGMNLDVFYPRDVHQSDSVTLLAMARPRTPRRGFQVLIDVFSILKNKYDNIEIILFGDDLTNQKIPFEFIDSGVISNQNKLAKLYSHANIFIDSSDFQGFGRTALEAMACHTACVLTNVGGVIEYAKDEYNCLLVPPKQPEEIVSAIERLLDDSLLMKRLIEGGATTANTFSHKREAKNTLNYFKEL